MAADLTAGACPYCSSSLTSETHDCGDCGRRISLSRIHEFFTSERASLEKQEAAYQTGGAATVSPLLAQWTPRVWRQGRIVGLGSIGMVVLLIGLGAPSWMVAPTGFFTYLVCLGLVMTRLFGWGAIRVCDLDVSFRTLVACPWAYEYGYADMNAALPASARPSISSTVLTDSGQSIYYGGAKSEGDDE